MSDVFYPSLPGLTWDITKTPLFNTIIQTSVTLAELRGSFTETPIYDITLQYDLLRDNLTNNELKQLLGFYLGRHGSFDSWLYQDPDDCTATNEPFGTGDGSTVTFQLQRAYGEFTEDTCNVAASPTIKVAGNATANFTLGSTGLVTFTTAPAANAALTWTGTFYLRCRFVTDNTPMAFNQFASKLWENKAVEFYGSFGTKI